MPSTTIFINHIIRIIYPVGDPNEWKPKSWESKLHVWLFYPLSNFESINLMKCSIHSIFCIKGSQVKNYLENFINHTFRVWGSTNLLLFHSQKCLVIVCECNNSLQIHNPFKIEPRRLVHRLPKYFKIWRYLVGSFAELSSSITNSIDCVT